MTDNQLKVYAYLWNNRVSLRKVLSANGYSEAVVELDRVVCRLRANRELRERVEHVQ